MIAWEKISKLLGSWSEHFKPFYDQGGFEDIYTELKKQGATVKILPEGKDLFKAFELCPIDKFKVCLISQDPYPMIKNGIVVADGLSYSCSYTKDEQPSLKLIYDAIETELYDGLNLIALREPNLAYWANQGVLLLNSSLTCVEGKPGSHKELWRPFMTYLLKEVMSGQSGVPFVFMGRQAAAYESLIKQIANYTKIVSHPASAAYKQTAWDSEGMFGWINNILKQNALKEIEWVLQSPF